MEMTTKYIFDCLMDDALERLSKFTNLKSGLSYDASYGILEDLENKQLEVLVLLGDLQESWERECNANHERLLEIFQYS